MKDLVIIGAGDFGREVAAMVERINNVNEEWSLLGFVDDNPELKGCKVDGYKVIGNSEWLSQQDKKIYAVCSIGNSKTREVFIKRISKNNNIEFAILIDPSAILMNNTKIGKGSIICAGAILTINVEVGVHSIINLSCTIGHDTKTGNYFTAHPGTNISGKVIIGDASYFGTGCKVIQGISISKHCIFGAGTVIVKSITESGTYVGVPAKKSRYNVEG